MSTSGSIDYSLTAKTLIQSALRMCGVLEHGKECSRDLMESGMFCLNLITKEMDLLMKPWTFKTGSITLSSSLTSYNVAAGLPNDIFQLKSVYLQDSSTVDLNVAIINEKRYNEIINKNDTGTVCEVYLKQDQDPDNQILYVYPKPDSAKVLKLRYFRYGFDLDADADEIDFPTQWGNVVRYSLAESLGEEFTVSDVKMARFTQRKNESLVLASKYQQKTTNLVPTNTRYY